MCHHYIPRYTAITQRSMKSSEHSSLFPSLLSTCEKIAALKHFWSVTGVHKTIYVCKYSLLCHITPTGQKQLIINVTTAATLNIQTGQSAWYGQARVQIRGKKPEFTAIHNRSFSHTNNCIGWQRPYISYSSSINRLWNYQFLSTIIHIHNLSDTSLYIMEVH